jgi:hypothetical protein
MNDILEMQDYQRVKRLEIAGRMSRFNKHGFQGSEITLDDTAGMDIYPHPSVKIRRL